MGTVSRPRAGERPVRLLGGRTLLGLSLRGRVARVLTLSAFLLAIVYCFAVLVLVRSDMFLDGLHVDAGDAAQQALYRDARAGLNLLIVVLVLLAVVAVVLGTFVWRALARDVVEPLDTLAQRARSAAHGDLSTPVPRVGFGEVAALAADVELMRAELAQQLDELRASHDEVEEAHEQLRAQAAELERSNRDLEQFAYVASHDLQEPLRKVASFTQLLGKRYRGQLDERADQYIDFATDGAKRMQKLIQDLLLFSRVGRSEVRDVPVDLSETLDSVLAERAETIAAAEATVTRGALPTVTGDPTLLRLVLTNLVGNAVKFRRTDVPPHVHVSAHDTGDAWQVSVTDNGIGIDPKYAERVFTIFQRLHAKEEYPGTGIGLALVQRVVEYHGGRAWVEAAPAGGTIVAFTLPHRRSARRKQNSADVQKSVG